MSANGKSERPAAVRWKRDHLERLLDQALADSFPASDPVAIDFEAPVRERASDTDRRCLDRGRRPGLVPGDGDRVPRSQGEGCR